MRHIPVLATAFLLALAACGGSGGGSDQGGDTIVPDVPADLLPDTVPDVPDNGRDPGGEVADPGTDVPVCACNTTDDCCDGCQPKNEGGTCGTPGPCEMPGHCASGACSDALPVACPPADTCHTGAGTCNPANGNCEYAAKADGADCESVAGKDGSGYCLAGACLGFGVCDHRTYDQPLNSACNFDGECESGRCASLGDDWTTYCTAPCGTGLAACPETMACVRDGEGFACQPKSATGTLPGGSAGGLFQVCNHDEDCAGGLCLGIDGRKFCADPCDDGTGKASTTLCGSCGECRDNGTSLGFKFNFYCVPQGVLTVGQPCTYSGECAKRYCHEGLCSEQCFVIEDLSSCPENMDCVAGVFPDDLTVQVCVPKGETGRGFFEECLGDYACADARKCLAVEGANRCTTECADDAPCATGTCVDAAEGKRCVPPEGVGTVGAGLPCQTNWQCVEGLSCFAGTCLGACQGSDSDCAEGSTCFPDSQFQAFYCAPACGTDGACPGDLGCWLGRCVLTTKGGTYVHGGCRLDADCETANCQAGLCTDTCSSTLPCEGADPIEPVEFGLCQPCDPALYDSDCNPPDTFGLNTCLTGIDGASFCAPDCTYRDSCPAGTRCYAINGYQKACAPVALTCAGGIGCTADGHCVKPQADGVLCADDAECVTGKCTDGFCGQARSCQVDGDCGCPQQRCDEGVCRPRADFVLELTHNDTLDEAMALPGAGGSVLAALFTVGDVPDVDYYRIDVPAGRALDVRTQPWCGASADTVIRLLAADGTPLPGWINDDIDPNGDYFSALIGYPGAGTDVLVEVTQSPYVGGFARFPYVLEWRTYEVAANDTCGGALPLPVGKTVGDLSSGVNTYSAPECTGTPGFGRDVAYRVEVPAGQVLRAFLESAVADLQMYLVSDCADPAGSCANGADMVGGPGTERLMWWNRTEATQAFYLVVDSYYLDSAGPFSLTVSLSDSDAPGNDLPAGAVGFPALTELEGTVVGAANDADPGDAGCTGVPLPGPEVFYEATLQAGDFLTARVVDAYGWTASQGQAWAPRLWLTTDPTSPAACVKAGLQFLSFAAPGPDPVKVYLVVDGPNPGDYGDFIVKVAYAPVGACNGPCDANSYVNACQDGALCTCNAADSVLEPVDCGEICAANGATAGACHAFTTPGYLRDSCMCEYPCDADTVAGLCGQGAYANCTCGAADPCGWKDDGTCDQFCMTEYPADHFDDATDCAPPPP